MDELIEIMKEINDNLTMIREDLDVLSDCVYEYEGKSRFRLGGGVDAYLYWD